MAAPAPPSRRPSIARPLATATRRGAATSCSPVRPLLGCVAACQGGTHDGGRRSPIASGRNLRRRRGRDLPGDRPGEGGPATGTRHGGQQRGRGTHHHRLRVPVQPADCTTASGAPRLLRDPAARCPAGGRGRTGPARHRALRRAEQRLRGRCAPRAGLGLCGWGPRPGHLLRDAAHRAPVGRIGRSRR